MVMGADWWWTGPSWWISVAVFFGALIIFHLALVYSPWPLSKYYWKRVDYIWLSMSLISILGIVSQGRMALAAGWVPIAQQQIVYRKQDVDIALASWLNGACAMHLEKSPESPPDMEERIKQQNQFCALLKGLQQTIKPSLDARTEIDQSKMHIPTYPLAIDFAYEQDFVKARLEGYNESIQAYEHLSDAVERSDWEKLTLVLAPFLLAVALALRITKVSAELK
jgi:hypothetical protein